MSLSAHDHLGRDLNLEVVPERRDRLGPIAAGAAAVLPLAVIVVGIVSGAFGG